MKDLGFKCKREASVTWLLHNELEKVRRAKAKQQ